MNFLTILAWICPLLLCSIGALYSEYAGRLALFMEALITFSGFLTYTFTIYTGSPIIATLLSLLLSMLVIFTASLLVEKFKANPFISALALNLLLGALTTLLSSKLWGNRGVLTSEEFQFSVNSVRVTCVIISFITIGLGLIFLRYTKAGLYLRISGSDPEVLRAKGVKTLNYRILSWTMAALFSSLAGSFLVFRISSFVPNISSGRGWMALAAVYLGKKKAWKISLSIFIFCLADILATYLQNYIPQIPSAILLSLPYFIMLLLIVFDRKNK
ncbi:MAG: ABC transporter permease [Treponema sp.]|nr:ABC transporter permease [Treponema sp.]